VTRDARELRIRVDPPAPAGGERAVVTVVDGAGTPVAGAVVSTAPGTADAIDRSTPAARTDVSGRAGLVWETAGAYTVEARRPDMADPSVEFRPARTLVRVGDAGADGAGRSGGTGGGGEEATDDDRSRLRDRLRVGVERGLPTLVYEGRDT
jgi:hypothetical protein